MLVDIIIVITMSYFVGTIPTAYIFGKIVKGIDIREHGSGNVGATNVLRVLGKTWGIICLLFDIFKGALGPFLAALLLEDMESHKSWMLLASVAMVFFGHLFPVWLKFKGGKGAAVTAGSFL
ncbi:MAG: glycerol-3-phosphate acyltransferase, partial [Spirochaetota bacterium]|nr:glycerol-3-phosphate acyltransferase [Spirochaetota bacterium]